MANNPQFTGIQPPRPPIAPLGPPQTALPSMPMQYRPVVPPQQPQPYMPVASQQFLPVGRPNIGMPSHPQQPHFSQPMQQLPTRPGQVGHILPPPPAQPIPVPDVLPNRPIISVSPQPQQTPQVPSNYMPGLGGPRLPVPSSYALSASSGGQIQINVDPTSQYQPMPQTNLPSFPAGGQPWPTVAPVQQSGEQTAVADTVPAMVLQPDPLEKVRSDWIEHTARNGKRYYYNKRTKFSSWEKPLELMTPIERADASTDWREITSPDGRKYYYNKVTKQSKWIIPDELKLAREQLTKESTKGTQESSKVVNFHSPAAEAKASPPTANGSASSTREVGSSPIPVEPVATTINPEPVVTTAGSSNLPTESSFVTTNAISVEPVVASDISVTLVNTVTTTNDSDNVSVKDVVTAADGVSAENTEEAKKGTNIGEAVNVTALEEKTAEQEPLVYENKQEAKIAFLALLETANIGSDWTWDQAMRVIINDQRYGALKTLGERKQAFNEFLVQKKKQEVEERRVKQKKAREDFKKMLEESKELTSSSRWSKSIAIFEDDERYIAVERAKDREDLFEDYILELEKKERAKAAEEHKRNRMEYIEFLKSCDFITASSQWRKVQDRLEADERCSRLEKIDRLEIFQEYLRDLEKEEEEQRKLWMEEVRRAERKNRDEFRKLMEEHVAAGTLTAKTHWRDYCMKLKELPAYLAVASNTSGATPKDLFEDVAEELQKQHLEDKDRIKDAVKLGKISVSSTWTIEVFKAAISQHIISSPPVSDINLKFVFDELQEKAREREEKEAKRRKRQADDFYEFLCSFKDITASSRWEDYKAQLEDRPEIRFNEDESFFREIFENYVTELKEKAREKERRRREEKDKEGRDREKRKQRRDKERGKGKDRHRKDEPDSENDRAESHSFEDIKRSGRDKDRKHRKRHHSSFEDLSLIEDEKDIRSKNFRRHSIDRKRSKQLDQYGGGGEADYESRNKRHKRDHRNGSHRNSDHEEKEFAEDGEVW